MNAPMYTIDTCAINDFLQLDRTYDKEVFESLWNHIDSCCDIGEIISHREVYEEIILGDVRSVVRWAKSKRSIFKDYSLPNESNLITKIGERFPMFLYQRKSDVFHADPWLVAQAKLQGLVIITSEKASNNSRIPYIAQQFGVDVVDVVRFFKNRGIKI